MRATRVPAVSHDQDTSSPKSLTPQRKHRKLLKDGSSEVWPEDVERIFVQGLREYWESPWATYSRGRSRWRNQFLVEYLQRSGIDRSKKQVASHIQVLRNMWKGEPEYHLVAGGEELFLDTGPLGSVKAEDLPDVHLLASVLDDHSPVSDRSGSSLSSYASHSIFPRCNLPMGSKMEPSIPPYPSPRIQITDDDRRRVRSMSTSEIAYTEQRRLSPLASSWTPDTSVRSAASQSCPSVPYTATFTELDINRGYERHMLPADQVLPGLLLSDSPRLYNSSLHFSTSVPVACPPILTQLSLWAEGMQPAAVPVDALSSSAQPADLSASVVALRVKLHLPPIDAPYSPALHGFQGSITCNTPRNPNIRCATAVFVRNQCTSRETTYCSVIATDPTGHEGLDTITLLLPDSPLSRSRWLDPNVPACIVQKIIVDEQAIAVIYYDLDRGQCENMPSAELVGFQKIAGHTDSVQSMLTSDAFVPNYTHTSGHCIPRAVHTTQTSLSHALIAPSANSPPQVGSFHQSPYLVSS